MRFSTAQIDTLGADAQQAYLRSLAAHAEAYFPTVRDACGPAGIARCAESALAQAQAYGFTGRASTRVWFDMQMLLGAEFHTDPMLAFLHPHLDWEAARAALRGPSPPAGLVSEDDEPDPIDMLDALHEDAWAWLDRTAGQNFRNHYRALARFRALLAAPATRLPDDPDGLRESFERLFPERARATEDAPLNRFLKAAALRAAEDGFAPGDGRALYVLRCLMGGLGAFRDPAFSIDGRGAADAPPMADPAARAEAHRQFILAYLDRLLASARRHGALEA